MGNKNITARIGDIFNNEIEDIRQKRLENGIDKKKKSTRELTNQITKHNSWKKIKKDTIELNLGNKE